MTLEAAFALLLSRYAGQDEVLVGTPVAGRHLPDVEPLVGLFVNTLVLRHDLSGQPGFREILGRVRRTALEAYQHESLPFELLVEALQPVRSLSHSPLFQVMFTLERLAGDPLSLEGIRAEPVPIALPTAKYDLTLNVLDGPAGSSGRWTYRTDLFDEATIARMAEEFEALLAHVVADADRPVAAIPWCTVAEGHAAVDEEAGRSDITADWVCAHELFAAQVHRTPEAEAVVCGDERLTYRELDRRAGRMARRLRDRGVGPEVLVGLCVERSCDAVAAALGILKAGGAYVPLDPSYPRDRLRFMIEDARLHLLLAEDGLRPDLADGVPVVGLSALLNAEVEGDADDPAGAAVRVEPEQAAYCIYTSGSTGTPKGVLVEHRGIPNLATEQIALFAVAPGDRVLQFAPLSFDASVSEIFTALLSGACLVVPARGEVPAGADLAALLQAHRVTVVTLPPSVLATLPEVDLPDLKTLVVAGEACPAELVARWAPGRRFVNAYGPTEATVCATAATLDAAAATGGGPLSIGRPIANVQVAIVDGGLQAVPAGVPGELCIGGAGLARGYLHRPGLTAARFIPNPFGSGRLYRTGDLARRLPDGSIEYLGRLDHQVKVRGFRIETGEVEAAILDHPAVREAVVVADGSAGGAAQRLIACVTLREGGAAGAPAVLREHLSARLPGYMVPAAIVVLDAMPVTPAGKIDRRALPPAGEARRVDADGYVEPRDPVERRLAAIWQEVLGLHAVGIRDSFFELGGHSLLAVPMMARIDQELGCHLPLATLFRYPTIEALAPHVRSGDAQAAWASLVPIQTQGSRPPFFCVPGAGGNVLNFYDLARLLGAEQPFYGLQAVGLDGVSEPHRTVEAMAAHYVSEIRRVQPHGPYVIGGHSFGGLVAFEMAQQLLRAGEEVARLIVLDTSAPGTGMPPGEDDPESEDEAAYLLMLAEGLEELTGRSLDLGAADLQDLDGEQRIRLLAGRLERAGLLPAGTDLGHVRAFARLFQAHHMIRYAPRDVIPATMTLIRAEQTSDGVREALARDATWGWGAFAREPVDVLVVPGSHTAMMAQPHVRMLAERLQACLAVGAAVTGVQDALRGADSCSN